MKNSYLYIGIAVIATAILALFLRKRRQGVSEDETITVGNSGVPTNIAKPVGYPAFPAFIEVAIKAVPNSVAARSKCMGNIRDSGDKWQGMTGVTSNGFVMFDDWGYGTRAVLKTLYTYVTKHGRNTIRKIITAYAPPTENVTSAYISRVATMSGFDADKILSQTDLLKIAPAMFIVETGINQANYSALEDYTRKINAHFGILK